MNKKILIGALACCLAFGAFAAGKTKMVKTTMKTKTVAVKTVRAQARLNVNTADVNTLVKIKGITKTRAKAIIAYRNKHGNFKNVADLSKVKGITKKRATDLNKYLTV